MDASLLASKSQWELDLYHKRQMAAHFIEFISLKIDEVWFMSSLEGQVTDCSIHFVFLANKGSCKNVVLLMLSQMDSCLLILSWNLRTFHFNLSNIHWTYTVGLALCYQLWHKAREWGSLCQSFRNWVCEACRNVTCLTAFVPDFVDMSLGTFSSRHLCLTGSLARTGTWLLWSVSLCYSHDTYS